MTYLLAIYRALVLIISLVVWPLIYSVRSIFTSLDQLMAFRMRRHWLKYIGYPILGIKLDEVKGEVSDGAYIYVANHRSIADPFVISKYLDAFVIAKAEVGSYPIVNKGFEMTGVLYVKREEKDSRKLVRQKMIETLKDGFNVLIYPEGTVGLKKNTLEFRPGAFYAAAENNIPVVPIALEYKSDESLWKNPNLIGQFFHEFGKRRKHVKLSIGKPFYSTDGEEIRKHCHNWINRELETMQQNWTEINFEA